MKEIILTEANFQEETINTSNPVLVDFWAPWCGPCVMLNPIVAEVANEMEGVKIAKVNIDDEPGLAQRFSVMSVPTLLFFKDGKVMDQMNGPQSKDKIVSKLKELKG